MSKKVTTEDFIKKAKDVHGDKFEYTKTIYTATKDSVIITCPIHGDFTQIANAHSSGKGCAKCSKIKADENRTFSFEKFVLLSNNRHSNFYEYIESDYKNTESKALIICPIHGEFRQKANNHLQGQGCSKCGDMRMVKSKTIKFETFLKRANKKHRFQYSYIEETDSGIKFKINIICKRHGTFNQDVINHLAGAGCPKCSNELTSDRMQNNPTGWNYTNWQKAGEKSKNFDSFKVYIIKCWNETEEFYKIGKTYTTVKQRFKSDSLLPYKFEVLKTISKKTAREAGEIEWILKNCNDGNKYVPILNFDGRYECFSQLDLTCFEEYNTDKIN